MKFYIVEGNDAGVVGCETSLEKAHQLGKLHGEYTIQRVECEVNSETVRRLLGDQGGYASVSEFIYPKGAQ
jgi:hypothetical protein